MASAHVAQGARLGGHGGAPAACSTTMGANAGRSSLDPIGPAVCLRTMSNGQALDLELNAVDGGGGHAVGLFA